ncbi:TPA: hypothetical protein GRR60_22630 [Vibrio parahaemolyticus]|nr:hypothetical protein [Vibrio parahaemolyticus]HAS6508876.1 hypothetical protein [Vibrio parahaemolyticus]
MNLGEMAILNPSFIASVEDKKLLEDFVRGLIHSYSFVELVLNLSSDDRVRSVNLRKLIEEMTVFELHGFTKFIELTQYYSIDELFSKELLSYLRLRR